MESKGLLVVNYLRGSRSGVEGTAGSVSLSVTPQEIR